MSSPQETSYDPSKHEMVDFGIYYLDMVQCPLDPLHQLRRHRLPMHIAKCRKNFPDKVPCPYGHYLFLEKHQMASHLQICPHKPKTVLADETQPHSVKNQNERKKHKIYNYDVDNFKTDEPYWD